MSHLSETAVLNKPHEEIYTPKTPRPPKKNSR